MKKLTLKALACTLCASLALVGGLVLTGCSGTDPEEAIRTDITTNFDALKSQEGALVDELSAQMEGMGLEDYGIEPSEVVTSVTTALTTRSTTSPSRTTPPRQPPPSCPSP